MSHRNAVVRVTRAMHSSPEWYTPRWLLERIAGFLGPSWYDPCPASYGKPAENGLAVSWVGKRVYCNPPYGRDIVPWIRKAMSEPTREIILLLPAYTDTAWFAPLFVEAAAILFIRGRMRFTRTDGVIRPFSADHPNPTAPHPSVLVYRGRRWRQFAETFCDLGPVLRTAYPMRAAQPTLLDMDG